MTGSQDESLTDSLQARAAVRRSDGTYPPDIDATLERVVEERLRSAATHTTALRAAVSQLRAVGEFELPRYRGSNKLKALYASAIEKAVAHVVADLVRQLEAYRAAVERVLDALVEEAETPGDHDRP